MSRISKIWSLVLVANLMAVTASAQGVGIRFDEMKVGTRIVTKQVGANPYLNEETFVGREGDEYVTEYYQVRQDGTRRFVFRKFYDLEGRWLRGERNGQATRYNPYHCDYVLGDCTATGSIPWEFTPENEKHSVNELKRRNRLDGDTLYLGTFLADGTLREYPVKLGKYNFRLSSEYETLQGKKSGYTFVELHEP